MVLVAMLAALGCGGTDVLTPGTLVITLDAQPPARTNASSVQISGQVTRMPEAPGVPLIVTLTRQDGAETDTLGATNQFAFTVTLRENAENVLDLTATDSSGSTGASQTVTVVHDGEGPRVSGIQPTNQTDGVMGSTPIVVTLTERLAGLAGPGITVSRQGADVPGTVTVSTDSLMLTFTPAAPWASNAIHTVAAGGARDVLGNLGTGVGACFVSAGAGATFADPGNDLWVAGSPSAQLVPVDISQIRLARGGGELRGILRFVSVHTLDFTEPNNLSVAIDFDTDADGGTGFTTVKDTVFDGVLAPSGARAETAVWLVSDPVNMVEPMVLQYTGPLQGTVAFTFTPGFCGPFIGFGVPEAAVGVGAGAFRIVVHTEAVDATGLYADPAPETGFHAVMLPGPPVAASTGPGAGPAANQPARTVPSWYRDLGFPLRRLR